MPWYIYIVQCRDGSLYTGITVDLDRRVAAHNAGKGGAYTRSRKPVSLVWTETAATRGDALRREHALKQLTPEQKRQMVNEKRGA